MLFGPGLPPGSILVVEKRIIAVFGDSERDASDLHVDRSAAAQRLPAGFLRITPVHEKRDGWSGASPADHRPTLR